MSENKVTNKLFTELFRPKTLDECILLPRVRSEFQNKSIDSDEG